MSKQEYVLGFLFRQGGKKVCLIRKTKPDWQAGKLNGVGGKVKRGEAAQHAMEREFQEATGATVTDWKQFCTFSGPGYRVTCFHSTGDGVLRSTTEEHVDWYKLEHTLDRVDILPNLRWLIPMALDASQPFAVITQIK
jgi:8-oxo-dGTP diphosphatase